MRSETRPHLAELVRKVRTVISVNTRILDDDLPPGFDPDDLDDEIFPDGLDPADDVEGE